jgi:hypothetical protein
MKTILTLSAAALLVLLAQPARAAAADEVMDASVEQYRSLQERGQWQNPLMPHGTGQSSAEEQRSGDELLALVVAGYSRQLLDRGGWTNPFVDEAHYAVGEPLLAVRIGDGVTTRTLAVTMPAQAGQLVLAH